MKRTIRLTESELRNMISDSLKNTLNEWGWGRKKQPQQQNQNNNEVEMWNRITQARELLMSLNSDGVLSKHYEQGESHDLSDRRSRLKLSIADAISSLERAIVIFKDLGYQKGKIWSPELNHDIKPYT
jgi:hypothetical protein